jgi:Glycosyltransferase WbsX
MLQEYGDEADWRAHFEYLLPFFQSPLYIRQDDRPVFLIHYSRHMADILEPMIQKWNEWALESGIPGVYIVEVITSAQKKPYSSSSSGILEFEPLHSVKNWITF